MKRKIIFIVFVIMASIMQAADKYWNVEVKLHRPKNDTSKVFIYSMLQSSSDTIKAVSIKGDKYTFHLPKENQFIITSSDKYETQVLHIIPVGNYNDKFVDIYLKDGGKKTIFDKQKEFEYIKDKKKEAISSIGGNNSNEVNVVVVKKQ
ncbi:MAG: hypothetical protein MR802_11445 [Prevotella sp.]|nr:hypothetical protein [Prevotella sp.]MCI7088749.1 hypothetical protein [Prevotella sp.]MDD7224953.1 hypothetical protein [Prevotella sp.]